MDIASIIPIQLDGVVRIGALVFALFHVFFGLILFKWVAAVNRQVHTKYGNFIIGIGVVHILVLACILVFIIFA